MILVTLALALAQEKISVYVGTYTGKESKGIYRFDFDPKSGKAGEPVVAAEVANPTFLAVHPNGKKLYAVGEIGDFEGKKSGAVHAFDIQADGSLKLLNSKPSGGGGPCHINVDPEGKNVLVANYGGGSCESIPIQADGSLADPASFHQHKGSSVNKGRQAQPHAHSINLDPAGKFAFVADLGLDQVLVYKWESGKLTPHEPPFAATPPGSGPRHLAFRPDARFAYTNGEMTSTVIAFAYDAEKGRLSELQVISTLPEPVKGNSTAEILVHPNGKTLYCSNRGHDSIAVFDIDGPSGKLTAKGHVATQGKTPRNFAIDPTGEWLFAENQGSDSIVIFKIAADGSLSPSGTTLKVAKPVCVRFVKG